MMFHATATLIGNSVGENTFRKTRVDNSEPAHNIRFRGSSATSRLTTAPAYYGNELDGPNHGKSFEYEYAALSGAIFPSPSKDTQFYAGCGAMQCDAAGADKGGTKAGARTRWRVDSP